MIIVVMRQLIICLIIIPAGDIDQPIVTYDSDNSQPSPGTPEGWKDCKIKIYNTIFELVIYFTVQIVSIILLK